MAIPIYTVLPYCVILQSMSLQDYNQPCLLQIPRLLKDRGLVLQKHLSHSSPTKLLTSKYVQKSVT